MKATQVTTQGEDGREQDEIGWVFQASSRLEILMILEAQKRRGHILECLTSVSGACNVSQLC